MKYTKLQMWQSFFCGAVLVILIGRIEEKDYSGAMFDLAIILLNCNAIFSRGKRG